MLKNKSEKKFKKKKQEKNMSKKAKKEVKKAEIEKIEEKNLEENIEEIEKEFEDESFSEFVPEMRFTEINAPVLQRREAGIQGEKLEDNIESTPTQRTTAESKPMTYTDKGYDENINYSQEAREAWRIDTGDRKKYEPERRIREIKTAGETFQERQFSSNFPEQFQDIDEQRAGRVERESKLPFEKTEKKYKEFKMREIF